MDCKKPYFVIVLIQTIYAGMFILSKAALNFGMNSFVFVFYRQAIATVFLIPFSLIFERKRAPPLSFTTFCKIFILSLLGITISLNIYGIALIYTSATLAAATTNTLPVTTFFLALLLRMESVNLKRWSGNAKIVGVGLCIAGAVTLAFYKGPHLKPLIHHHILGDHQSTVSSTTAPTMDWIKGCFIMVTANTLWGLWLVLQVKVLESYPSKLLLTTLQCFLSTIQSFVIGIIFARDPLQWKLRFDVGFLAVAYCGIMVTGVTFYFQTWCVEKRGPVFLAMSTPLSLVITIFCSAVFLGELISLGSVLGGLIMVGGLYSFLWGKSREHKKGSTMMDQISVEDDEKMKEQTRDVRLFVEEDKKTTLGTV
ncbi:hypothetical protein Sjap_022717 [Stephania japonica]|uniref:WAT1-related protein n=1 Tax=Stephania japonica TaxID=461633 RepID=A0AAP0ES02_9MAGN